MMTLSPTYYMSLFLAVLCLARYISFVFMMMPEARSPPVLPRFMFTGDTCRGTIFITPGAETDAHVLEFVSHDFHLLDLAMMT